MGHAIAMVRWSQFRPGDSGGLAHDYGSRQARLHTVVGDGGTLWLVTSRKKGRAPRTYHLAYKLEGCRPIEPEHSVFSGTWPYVVRAAEKATHFGYNDATETLHRLRFTSGRPMAEVTNAGMRLMTIPILTTDDVALLEGYQHRLETGRSVFLSYARDDAVLAAALEAALAERNISVARDLTFLRAGDDFAAAIEREVAATDSFAVLITASSARSNWVRREITWAAEQLAADRFVKRIVPLVVDEAALTAFPELARLHQFSMTSEVTPAVADRLAAELRSDQSQR